MMILMSIWAMTSVLEPPAALKAGPWRAVFHSPGGELPFFIQFAWEAGELSALCQNGEERLAFDVVELDGNQLTLGFDHYESTIISEVAEDGESLVGEWTKVVGRGKWAKLRFTATFGEAPRFAGGEPAAVDLTGRWRVEFRQEGKAPKPAVAVLMQSDHRVSGTFLTPTGDYRYLEGNVWGEVLSLSCFDGGHAFLFRAILDADGRLKGDFWSRDTWHEGWQAERDAEASLVDPYQMTKLSNDDQAFRFAFPDLNGDLVSHDDRRFEGKVRLITIFGSWCPNCNDEAQLLGELYRDYRQHGFEVVGLAFEMTGDEARDRKVLKRFANRFSLDYTILLAGGSTDKLKTAAALPDLDGFRAYPTSLLVDRMGKVVSIHTGFSGPGTGPLHEDLVRRYRTSIEALLDQ